MFLYHGGQIGIHNLGVFMKLYAKSLTLILIMSGSIHSIQADTLSSPQPWWLPSFIYSKLYPTPQDPTAVAPEIYNPCVAVIDFSDNTDIAKLERILINAVKDPAIHGILLTINHSGGGGDVVVIHDLITRIKRIKPVVGLIRGTAYSAGYWVASATDYLIAHSASDIGSIGALREIHRWQDPKYNQPNGYDATAKIYLFKAGKYKAIGNAWNTDLSDDEKKYVQENLNGSYDLFKNTVASNRGLDLANADDWAEGKEFIASKALKLNLIDEIGTGFEAEEKLIELIHGKYTDEIMSKTIEYVFIS